ncbi:MAG TPA: bifunctional DNA-formamidopyrimidine glycosylase/DNA-(apurinic or apyrimidinic site) lyase [Erysipelotrichaceae bacterium]|nr:bifunctional DNA-formamidopyrimidine glycosylase/DNA-(apurinic or apyrimidinic site) lyase [Erysipelotrichaceae bacterium]
MPELPEVETVVLILDEQIKGHQLLDHSVYWDKTIVNHQELLALHGQKVMRVSRRGKYILWQMETSNIVIHLRMEGKFYKLEKNAARNKHSHVIFHFDDFDLAFNDTRKFGRIEVSHDLDHYFSHKLGFEPWDEHLTKEYLRDKAKSRKVHLKTFLLDQSVIAGIGNIYADEICFKLKLSPFTRVHHIPLYKWEECIESTRQVLAEAIASGGTTVRSYTASLGITGRFQLQIHVYGRANQPCHTCNTALIKSVVGQRSTVYCPKCQKRI